MSNIKIDGSDFERMIKAGFQNIRKHELEVNNMNVFPVPDGDTGTNLCMTMQNGIINSSVKENLGEYLQEIKNGMLLGARGNSGVILSQFFTGIASSLKDVAEADCKLLAQAFVDAYKTAYKSVINPVEGTVLTVAREGADKVLSLVDSFKSVEEIFDCYINEMKNTLEKTPDLLPILKESGVLDSGGKGYIYIVEGMLKGVSKEFVPEQIDSNVSASVNSNPIFDTKKFNRESKFEDGYCTEFILQLLSDKKYNQDFSIDDFIDQLKNMGDSLVAFQTDDRVKVHIHTLKPYLVIELAQRYGEFVTFKMENMQIQHNEHDDIVQKKVRKSEHKNISIIAVVNGDGMKELYEGFGCDIILDGGTTMNTSAKEFVDAINSLDSNKIIILPNNKNNFLAAKQAVEISGNDNIVILESENMLSGYFGLAMGQVDCDFETQLSLMKDGIKNSEVISVTTASKDYVQDKISCKKNDLIALLNGNLVSSCDDINQTVEFAIKKIDDYKSKESCLIVYGKNVTDETVESLSELIEKILPDTEINVVDGGQEIFNFIIGF